MTITESRLKEGTFTLGDETGTGFACQATNVHVTPSYDSDGDAVETLCGDEIPEGKKESWVIGGTSIQDFDDPAGFLTYCYEHAMETTPFSWQPNVNAPTYSGDCVVVALEEGGDVNSRLTTDWEFDVVGRPDRTMGGAGGGDVAATGATAGTPGEWTPSGSTPPADAADAAGLTANPATPWATGEYVQGSTSGTPGEMTWSGTDWVSGRAP